MKEAILYERLDDNKVRCNLCNHRCVIPEGGKGVCRVRVNEKGRLYTLVYGKTISQHIDPIEKKPLYHYLPGSRTYSIAAPGCNFHCQWCQNWGIVHMTVDDYDTLGQRANPAEIVYSAKRSGSQSIAYTYTEPTVFFEYAYETAKLAQQEGLRNIFVTNGYMTTEMLNIFHPYLDAANIDLKSFREETYHHYVGAELQPILENLKKMKELDIWLEVTTLIIPGLNDDPAELRDSAQFICEEIGPETPWHVSRFIPHHKMRDRPPTPLVTLSQAREIGIEEGLHFVYIGNIAADSNTYCDECGSLLIHRQRFLVHELNLQEGCCPNCGKPITGVWA